MEIRSTSIARTHTGQQECCGLRGHAESGFMAGVCRTLPMARELVKPLKILQEGAMIPCAVSEVIHSCSAAWRKEWKRGWGGNKSPEGVQKGCKMAVRQGSGPLLLSSCSKHQHNLQVLALNVQQDQEMAASKRAS